MTAGNTIKILYDGACPLCGTEMNFLKKKDKAGVIVLEDISKSDFDPSFYGKTTEELNRFIHAQLADGSIISGMEVFRKAYTAVGLGYLLWPTRLPVIKQLSDLGYYIFAKYRISISRFFGRKPPESCNISKQ